MPRLIWVFAGHIVTLLVLSWGSSNNFLHSPLFWSAEFDCLALSSKPLDTSPNLLCEKLAREPQHDKTKCAQQRLSSAWASAQSDQSLCCPPEEDSSFLHMKCTAQTDQTGRMCRLIWVFAERRGHFVGFVILRLKCTLPSGCFGQVFLSV